MPRTLETVVAAAAAESARRALVKVLAQVNLQLLAMPRDGFSALEALEDFRPDLLLCDAQLPFMEGRALVRRALCTSRLSVRPAAILLRDPCFPLPEERSLTAAGARILSKPLRASELQDALAAMQQERPVFPAREQRMVDMLLDALGVPDHAGRTCLRMAVLLCVGDARYLRHMGSSLYPRTGELCAMSAKQVERAMRHAIDLAWRSDKLENQNRIFANTVDAGRGQPACSEMIFRLADILRLEG